MTANPFPRPTPLGAVLLRELVEVAAACYARGWSYGTAGNFSWRGTGGLIWQSPSGLAKGALAPEVFIPVELATGEAVGPLPVRPSLEMPVHLGIYRAVPSAQTVVHTHPPGLVRASLAGDDLVFQGEEMQKALGCHDHLATLRLPVAPNPTPEEMRGMAAKVPARLAPGVPLLILAGHGVFAWGKTPREALAYVEAAEFLCRTRLPSV